MGLDLSENSSSETMYIWQEKSKPGYRIAVSVTILWMTTEADDQSSLHYIIVLTDVMYDHIGRWDASRGGGCNISIRLYNTYDWLWQKNNSWKHWYTRFHKYNFIITKLQQISHMRIKLLRGELTDRRSDASRTSHFAISRICKLTSK